MLKLVKILKDNKISYMRVCKIIDIPMYMFVKKINFFVDFSIDELKKLKNYFVNFCGLSPDYDLGSLLDDYDEPKAG